jgi:hypothetical protein
MEAGKTMKTVTDTARRCLLPSTIEWMGRRGVAFEMKEETPEGNPWGKGEPWERCPEVIRTIHGPMVRRWYAPRCGYKFPIFEEAAQ